MKAKAKRLARSIWRIHWLVWLVLFLSSTSVSIMALRGNNLKMIELRDAVHAADKAGKGINEALNNLRSHVYSHMNTSLTTTNGVYPPVQLGYTYDRLKQRASDDVYRDAQTYCEKNQPKGFYGAYRISCVQNYVQSHPIEPSDIPAGLYQFDFVSPAWSPDLAGWSLAVSSILLVIFLAKFVSTRI